MNTVLVFCVVSFTLSIDYSLGLISTQSYWINAGGSKSLSGLVFGLYDGIPIILTLPMAWLCDTGRLSYKKVIMCCLLINIIGNILYGSASIAKSWVMILIGRTIAGIGGTCLPLLMSYVADKIPRNEQQKTIGYIKYTAALSRSIGPVLGSIFSSYVPDKGLFNLYTLVGWIPVVFGIISMVVVFFWKECGGGSYNGWSGESGVDTLSLFIPFWIIGFVSTLVYWYFVGNIFIIGTHYFKIVHNSSELGRLYYAGLGGFVIAFIIFFCFKNTLSSCRGLVTSTVLFCLTIWIFVISNNDVVFYIAVGFATCAYGLTIPSINYLNNYLAKHFRGVLKGKFGIFVTALTIFQGVARFIGPTLFTLTIHLNEGSDCVLNETQYIISGCKMDNYVSISLAYIISSIVIICISVFFAVRIFTNIEKNEATQITPLIQNK